MVAGWRATSRRRFGTRGGGTWHRYNPARRRRHRHQKKLRERTIMAAQQSDYRFSFGPWNIHEGADPFGPTVRPSVEFAKKLKVYKELGFEGVQFHDDDAVPEIDKKSAEQVAREAREEK